MTISSIDGGGCSGGGIWTSVGTKLVLLTMVVGFFGVFLKPKKPV